MIMANGKTFGSWLADQQGRTDAVGQLAEQWRSISPGRVHAVQGVRDHLGVDRDASGERQAAFAQAVNEYRDSRGEQPLPFTPRTPEPPAQQPLPLSEVASAPAEEALPLPEPQPAAPYAPADVAYTTEAMAAQEPEAWAAGVAEVDRIVVARILGHQAAILDILASHTRFLAAIAVRLGLSATAVKDLAAVEPDLGDEEHAQQVALGIAQQHGWVQDPDDEGTFSKEVHWAHPAGERMSPGDWQQALYSSGGAQ